MNRLLTIAAIGSGLLLAACADSDPMSPPELPAVRDISFSYASSATEQLYLIDNLCNTSDPAQCTNPGGTGSKLYSVGIGGGNAQMTLLKSLIGACVTGNPAIDCSDEFDQAHIGGTPDGTRVYAINRRKTGPVGSQGNSLGYYDVATGNFVYVGRVSGIGPMDGTVLAGFSVDGGFYVANQDADRLYQVTGLGTGTPAVAASWQISKSTGGSLNLMGADITFTSASELFIWTNAAGDRGLWKVTISGASATATHVGGSGQYFTGLAVRDAGLGNLVMSNATDDRIYEINPATGATIASYPMTGDLTNHQFGDMTTGALVNPQPELAILKTAGAAAVPAGSPISFTMTVSNSGAATATAVTLTDVLPAGAGISWVIDPAVAGCSIAAGTLTCNFGDLAPAASRSVTVTSPTTAASCKSYPNTASASASNHATVQASATTAVTCPSPPALGTFTMGGWGSTPKGNNPGALLRDNFATVYPAGVWIGGTRKASFTTSTAIRSFLPAGGKASRLTQNHTNPSATEAGVLAGQVLALTLNVDFSAAGVTPAGLGSAKIASGVLAGKTVSEVLAIANAILGGAALPYMGITSYSQISDIATKINENYNEGANKGFLIP